jgi:hypothetical protein
MTEVKKSMDCHVAALLAMTEAWPRNDASTASQQQKHGLRLLKMIIVVYGYF